MNAIKNDFLLLLRVSRPAGWVVGLLLFLTGFYVSEAEFRLTAAFNLIPLLLFPIIIFGLNDVYDYRTDSLSSRKNSFLEGFVLPKDKHAFTKRAAIISAAIIILFSLATKNLTNIIATMLAVCLAYAYSAPPLRLKEKPVFDSLANTFGVMLILLIGFSYGGNLLEFPLKLVYASLGAASLHALGAVMDYSADKKVRVRTIATFFGKRFASLFAALMLVIILLFSGIKSLALSFLVIWVLIVSIVSFLKPNEKLVKRLFWLTLYVFFASLIAFIHQQFYK